MYEVLIRQIDQHPIWIQNVKTLTIYYDSQHKSDTLVLETHDTKYYYILKNYLYVKRLPEQEYDPMEDYLNWKTVWVNKNINK